MSDEEEDRVEAMSPQEVMDYQMRIQAREKGDPIDFLIERGCKRASEEIMDNAVRDNRICAICQAEYSGPCFSLSACTHIFHSDCLNNLFENRATNKHVICPCCNGQHATMGTEGQAKLLAEYRLMHQREAHKRKRLAKRMRKIENSARKCQLMVRYFLTRNHFIKLRHKVVICQTIARKLIATKRAATLRFLRDDDGGQKLV